jgi:hypothetical protein
MLEAVFRPTNSSAVNNSLILLTGSLITLPETGLTHLRQSAGIRWYVLIKFEPINLKGTGYRYQGG